MDEAFPESTAVFIILQIYPVVTVPASDHSFHFVWGAKGDLLWNLIFFQKFIVWQPAVSANGVEEEEHCNAWAAQPLKSWKLL